MSKVVPITAAVQTSAFGPPAHFRTKALRAAWKDLVDNTEPALHVKQQRFTFEMAAMLLAKMRGGKSMTATESKQLKQHMIALGLATSDADDRGKRKSKNAGYFDGN